MDNAFDYITVNEAEWDRRSREGDVWTLPVSHEEFLRARDGVSQVCLTPIKPVPAAWLPDLRGRKVLGLAAGGGQQCPIFIAQGASVTVFDVSGRQLETELIMAEREHYSIDIVKGNMANPLPFADSSFDLVFHPVSNCYIRDVNHVWRECVRVLKPGGRLLAGFANPCVYLFEDDDPLRVANRLPYDPVRELSDDTPPPERTVFEFSHSLTTQIGGQLAAGLNLLDLYEDTDRESPVAGYFPCYIATLAVKPS